MHPLTTQSDTLPRDRAQPIVYRLLPQILDRLSGNPAHPIRAEIFGFPCDIRIVIPGYGANIKRHYADVLRGESLGTACRRANVSFEFDNFGVEIRFDSPAEIAVHDQDLELDDTLRQFITRFGPVILKNAYLPSAVRQKAQRNIFPHLNFHYDRGSNQPTQYSLFSRDPFDAVQRAPRDSSTVFVANIVCVLQCMKEEKRSVIEPGFRSNYEVFRNEATAPLIGDIWLEHAWDEPIGTGEISVLDNRTVLHASYYRDRITKGYPIGVRYLR